MWRSILVAVGVRSGTEGAPSPAVRRTQKSLECCRAHTVGSAVHCCARGADWDAYCSTHLRAVLLSPASEDCFSICGIE